MARVRKSPPIPESEAGAPPSTALVPVARAEAVSDAPVRRAGAARRPKAPPPREVLPVAQLGWLAGMAGSVFTTVALWGYDPQDPSFSVVGRSAVHNPAGRLGAVVADLMFQSLGYLAWGVVLLGVACGLRLAGRPLGGVLGFVAAAAAAVSMACGLELAMGSDQAPFRAGGVIGLALAGALRSQVGTAGASIAVGAVLVSAVTVLFRLDWQPLAARVVRGVEEGGPRVVRRLGAAGAGAARASAALGRVGADAVRGLGFRSSATDPEDDADMEDDEGDEGEELQDEPSLPPPARAAAAGPPARPTVAPSVARALPAAQRGVWSSRPAPVLVAEPDVPTQVSNRSLVEVEWEATATLRRAGASSAGAAPSARGSADPGTAGRAVRATSPDLGPRVDGRGRGGAAALPRVWEESSPMARAEPARRAAEPELFRPMELEELTDPEPPSRALPEEDARAPMRARRLTQVDVEDPDGRPSAIAPARAPGSPALDRPMEDALGRGAPRHDGRAPDPRPADAVAISPGAAPEFSPPRAIIPLPDDPPDPAPAPAPRRKGRGAAVMPGDLRSGGVNDDGSAVRSAEAFMLPPLSLMDEHPAVVAGHDETFLQDLARRVTAKLRTYGVEGKVVAIRPGPVITLFEYEPAAGVKLSRISSLSDDLAMALEALSVRIVAPIPGRGVVGIEIPNKQRQIVWARDVFASGEFRNASYILPVILGKDTEGKPYVSDLAKMPHLLVGGTTGSGKSVGINTMLCSLLYTRTPVELKLILVDPKMLEFELYQDIPHLLHPVVTEPKLASAVLKWACKEMDERYKMLARWQTRNIEGFNQKVTQELVNWTPERAKAHAPKDWMEGDPLPTPEKLPYIVIVIDELADLMMVASKDVEESIVRLAQKARAAGIHLIVATQRPSVDVITGLIKANMPSRLAYQVRSKTDGRTILDQNGAESLLGKGDLLFLPPGVSGLIRIHGPFLADDEVRRVAEFLKSQGAPNYALSIEVEGEDGEDEDADASEMDETYDQAVSIAIELGRISTSMIQRRLKIGYNRAARIMELMEREGVVGAADGVKPREVLVGRGP